MSNNAKLSRVTVIVNTKVSKKAVVRNLFKRRVRSYLESVPLPFGDLVVTARKGAAESSFQELSDQLQVCLKKIA